MGALGLATALLTQFIGLGMTGAGHGWIAPFYFSMPLFLLYPAALIRAFRSGRGGMAIDLALLAVALALDLLLLRNIFGEENRYFHTLWGRFPGFVLLWIALWAGWQALALIALLRNSRFRIDAQDR